MSGGIRALLIVGASYFLGGVPFGLLIARWVAGIDVREHGSGNIGATNVYRVVGWKAGVAVWVLDVAKGLLPVVVADRLLIPTGWQLGAGLAALVGHSFSPFLRFRGGKGGATGLGVLLGLMWPVGLLAFGVWALVLLLTGYVSLGTICGAASLTPFTLWLYPGDTERLLFAIIGGGLTIARHHSNIRRLFNGTENRFGRLGLFRKAKNSTDKHSD